jgi:hypothetical protein
MNRFIPIVAVLGLASGIAVAQPPEGPRGGALDIERLAILLDLDAYQKGEVERVLEEQRAARLAAREERAASGERPTREEMFAQREEARAALRSQLQNILTEQQLTKLDVLTEMRSGPGGPGGRRGPRGNAL